MNRERRISNPIMTDTDHTPGPELRPHAAAFPTQSGHRGLTTREYFAAIAMQGVLASPYLDFDDVDQAATDAVAIADALIKALNR